MAAFQNRLFCNGYPVSSAIALSNEEFKLCGEVMMMSVLQGGPVPNFLAPPLAAYFVGKPLSLAEVKNIKYKKACENVCYKFPSLLQAIGSTPIFYSFAEMFTHSHSVLFYGRYNG